MIMQVFTVHDSAVGAFLPPMFMRSQGEAVRAFVAAVNSPDHQFAKHYLDYTLMFLGQWDDASGKFETLDNPKRVLGAVEALEKADPVMPPTARRDGAPIGNGR